MLIIDLDTPDDFISSDEVKTNAESVSTELSPEKVESLHSLSVDAKGAIPVEPQLLDDNAEELKSSDNSQDAAIVQAETPNQPDLCLTSADDPENPPEGIFDQDQLDLAIDLTSDNLGNDFVEVKTPRSSSPPSPVLPLAPPATPITPKREVKLVTAASRAADWFAHGFFSSALKKEDSSSKAQSFHVDKETKDYGNVGEDTIVENGKDTNDDTMVNNSSSRTGIFLFIGIIQADEQNDQGTRLQHSPVLAPSLFPANSSDPQTGPVESQNSRVSTPSNPETTFSHDIHNDSEPDLLTRSLTESSQDEHSIQKSGIKIRIQGTLSPDESKGIKKRWFREEMRHQVAYSPYN
jgi:hypothetical protein